MKAWQDFLSEQENELGLETVQKWLRPLRVTRFDAANLHLEAKDSFQVLWFEEHLRRKVSKKLVNQNNKKIRVHLTVAGMAKPATKNRAAEPSQPASTKQNLLFHDCDPLCTFANYVVNEEAELTYRLLKEVAEGKEGAGFNPIYLFGQTGSGKSHLLMALSHAFKQRQKRVLYCRAENFTEHVVGAIRSGDMSAFRHAYRNVDVLIVDDIHVFSRKGATQEEFFHTFNTLHLSGKQIILAANCPPRELEFIEPRLVSRFEWGIVLPLEALKGPGRSALLEKKAQALGLVLPPKVAEFLLEHFASNNASLARALEAIVLRSSPKTLLHVEMLTVLLKDLLLQEKEYTITPQRALQTVSEVFGMRIEDITGKMQSREFVLPRQIAMYICRLELKMPFTKIGELFSKDHSTVMASVKVIQKALEKNDQTITTPLSLILKKLR